MKKNISINNAKKILLESSFINRSLIAEKMYPSIKASSANAKLYNKLKEVNGFRLTKDEQDRLIDILTAELKIIAAYIL